MQAANRRRRCEMRHSVWQTGRRIAGATLAGGLLIAGVWAAQAAPAPQQPGMGPAPGPADSKEAPAPAGPAPSGPPVPANCLPLWATVPSPNFGPLVGVAAAAANDVWAISDSTVLHWDGQGWAPTPTPAPAGSPTPTPTPNLNLSYGARHYHGLAAAGANDVWASGHVDAS